MKTITLEPLFGFAEAVQCLLDGKCIGIRPEGNGNFIVKYKPRWMNQDSPDYVLAWSRSVDFQGINDGDIRTNQILSNWQLVIIDHNDLPENIKQSFIFQDICKITDKGQNPLSVILSSCETTHTSFQKR